MVEVFPTVSGGALGGLVGKNGQGGEASLKDRLPATASLPWQEATIGEQSSGYCGSR